jgi:hypothetical protein
MKKLLSLTLLALVPCAALANTCTIRQAGSTDQTVYVEFVDATTGVPNSSLAYNTSGIDLEYVRAGAAAVDITEATQTTAGAHSDGGFVSVGHGRYRLDLPDAAVAAGVPEVIVQGVITGYVMLPCAIALSPPVNVVAYDGTVGAAAPLGIVDQGTAQSATGTTLVLRSALAMGDDTAIGMTLMACGSTQGYCQSRSVTDYVSSTDTATVATWTVTPSGTITYYLFATSPSSGGGGASAADIWSYGTRILTALDEDVTTIDLDSTYVGGVMALDEDITAIDLNGITIGTVTTATTATNLTNLPAITAGWLTATGIASDAFTAAKFASDVTTELQTGLATASALSTVSGKIDTVDDFVDTEVAAIKTKTDFLPSATAGASGGVFIAGTNAATTITTALTTTFTGNLTGSVASVAGAVGSVTGAVASVTGNVGGNVTGSVGSVASGGITAASIATDAIGAAEIAADAGVELAGASFTLQHILTGTCDSGSTTTCVDNALTQADSTQLADRLICFDDSFCALITAFTPGSDTVTITKVAPSTRGSKVYTIFPSTLE